MLGIGQDNLHHAYLILGEIEKVRPQLLDSITLAGIEVSGNPDFYIYEEESFGINEARLLRERAQGRSFGERKAFVISARITLEAQNALLKTLEDPTDNTHFFVISREESLIIPTLRSRMHILRMERDAEGVNPVDSVAGRFLSSSLSDRLEFARKFADEERSLPVFLDNLLLAMKSLGKDRESLVRVYRSRLFADDRAVSSRLVLEHLALVL